MLYTSTQNGKIKELKKLNQKKVRDLKGLFLVEGEHLVLEALKKGCLIEIYVLEGYETKINVPTFYVNEVVMKFISELESYPNMIGVCKKVEASADLGNSILLLDNIQDPGNLGTIIRSASAFNINTIIASLDTVDFYNSKVVRASQGMLFHVNLIKRDLKKELLELKENGYKIYSTNVKNGKDIKKVEKSEKFAIIMGNEGSGVSDELANLADEFLYIPMSSNCESLNVAVATSIILYELDK